jgi:transmembrane sensor
MERAILDAAARWFAELGDDRADDAVRARWRAWLAADPRHAAAWARVEALAAPIDAARGAVTARAANTLIEAARRVSRRRALQLLSGGGVAVSLGLLLRDLPWRAWEYERGVAHARLRTRVGEIARVDLADGGTLTLDTASVADVEYSARLRRVIVYAGRAHLATAHDRATPARPFVVDTLHGRMTALGTRFTVEYTPAATRLDVLEGAVRVEPAAARPGDHNAARIVRAGERTQFDAQRIATVSRTDPARAAWADGLLIADDVPLADFIAELARYTQRRITLAPAAARLRLVGSHRIAHAASDLPRILQTLENALPVRVTTTEVGWRIAAR